MQKIKFKRKLMKYRIQILLREDQENVTFFLSLLLSKLLGLGLGTDTGVDLEVRSYMI